MYLIPQFYLYNSQLPSYCTKNTVTIKPKYKENFLLHERTKKIYISIRLCVLRNHKLINSNIVLYNGTIFKYSKNDKKNQLIVLN